MMDDGQELSCVVVDPPGPVDACVVWLHGLGADGHDFEPLVPHLGLPAGHGVRFVFPHAPVQPVTLNGGMRMRAWYDIVSPDLEREVDHQGIRAACSRVGALLQRERNRGVAAGRVVLAGFSQGGVVALHHGLYRESALAGILALSCYWVAGQAPPRAVAPVLMMHGRFDEVVPLALAQRSCLALQAAGVTVQWREYAMGHEVCPEQIGHIGTWLRRVLAL